MLAVPILRLQLLPDPAGLVQLVSTCGLFLFYELWVFHCQPSANTLHLIKLCLCLPLGFNSCLQIIIGNLEIRTRGIAGGGDYLDWNCRCIATKGCLQNALYLPNPHFFPRTEPTQGVF